MRQIHALKLLYYLVFLMREILISISVVCFNAQEAVALLLAFV